MTETMANGYSSESTQRELSNEYQHDRVLMVFKDFSVLVLWTNVASALEGLIPKLKWNQGTSREAQVFNFYFGVMYFSHLFTGWHKRPYYAGDIFVMQASSGVCGIFQGKI